MMAALSWLAAPGPWCGGWHREALNDDVVGEPAADWPPHGCLAARACEGAEAHGA